MKMPLLVVAALLGAGAAAALDPPKVVVTYSYECSEGGRYIETITDTPLGLGNQVFVVCVEDDESPDANAVIDSPQTNVVEFTADPNTQEIIDGPVELVDSHFRQQFEVFAIGGASTTVTDLTITHERKGFGMLSGDVVTWDNTVPYQIHTVGSTDCFGNATICSLAAPPGGWPRIEPLVRDLPLPKCRAIDMVERADFSVCDNLTPDDPTDDILAAMDSQATVYNTLIGNQISRVYVPEPGASVQAIAGVLAVVGLARLRPRRN